MAPPERFELPTPRSEDECSNPLSYGGTQKSQIVDYYTIFGKLEKQWVWNTVSQKKTKGTGSSRRAMPMATGKTVAASTRTIGYSPFLQRRGLWKRDPLGIGIEIKSLNSRGEAQYVLNTIASTIALVPRGNHTISRHAPSLSPHRTGTQRRISTHPSKNIASTQILSII
jgi:hypothetical protein